MKYYETLPTHTETPRNTTRKIANLYIGFKYHFLTLQKQIPLLLNRSVGLRPANERRRYFVTTSLIRWAQTYNQPWHLLFSSLSLHQEISRMKASILPYILRFLIIFEHYGTNLVFSAHVMGTYLVPIWEESASDRWILLTKGR